MPTGKEAHGVPGVNGALGGSAMLSGDLVQLEVVKMFLPFSFVFSSTDKEAQHLGFFFSSRLLAVTVSLSMGREKTPLMMIL